MNGSTDPQICNGTHSLVVKFSEMDKRNEKSKMMAKNANLRNPIFRNYQIMAQTGFRYNPMGMNAYDRVANPYQNFSNTPYFPENYNMSPTYSGFNAQYGMPNNNKNYMPMVPNGPDGVFCLFVYNLPNETDDNLLYRLFNPYGSIASVKVIKENNTGQCKGYAFVNYYKYEDAYAAVNDLNGKRYSNKILQVSFKKPN